MLSLAELLFESVGFRPLDSIKGTATLLFSIGQNYALILCGLILLAATSG